MLKNLRSKLFTPWMLWLGFLGLILLGGLLSGIFVFWKGLSITHLSDLVPWGLWITIDLSSIALAGGAFSLCAAVHLFGLKRYEPIARTATFVGLIGYTMAMLALVLDIGRPDRFWKALVYWNPHSLLWEVTIAIMLYTTVLAFETMPIFARLEWLRKHFPKIAAKMEHIHHYAPILAIIGLGLSSMHQSSLGAAYGIIKGRPFWFKPEMSVLFMLSAIVGGISLTLFASMLSSQLTSKAKINDALIERVSRFVGWLLIGYFYFRAWDALSMSYTYDPGRSEGLRLMTKGPLAFNFWIGEMLLAMIVPMILLLYTPTRTNRFWRMLALFLIAAGVVAFRWDINISGLLVVMPYVPGQAIAYTSYRPSLIEILTGSAIIAYGLTAFSLGVKYLRVVDHSLIEQTHETVTEQSSEVVPV
ncbi:MAG TPA: NrfD/PsrC family molybdoenzyme membrane anchor subunit [Anaerolineales bacterium]|nr:NrfD/PsrC family molybdoenzyme membrane anchor subunit [Anaerolineales bacterium]HLO28060.1 NrfD/PsrC family molybdoenzyme membrane anchor subunit [Anaerolineales bacterium]